MDEELLNQLLGGGQTANTYGKEFFSMPPEARLETLKQRQFGARNRGEELDPTGSALMQLLTRRVAREQRPPLTSSEQSQQTPEDSLLQRLKGMDPLAPLRTQQY